MQLRDYQSKSIEMLYAWMGKNQGHPCIVMPTGSGKSHVIAAFCKNALQEWPETRILMLTHIKELIQQNAEKMCLHWPGAPLGIYSAGIGKRELGQPITFAGIQSVRNKAEQIGHTDIILIDECHLVSHKEEGGYRKLIADLTTINPHIRIVGYSATPYRLGHGLITDKPALFDALIEPVSIEELVHKKYLATLRSKLTTERLDVSGVHKRGGEYIDSELQAAVDNADKNIAVVREVIKLAGNRRAWLFFCAGVKHAQHVCLELTHQGVTAACVTGDTPKAERDRILTEFKAGRICALTNANVLTTGFDYPDIDLIAMLRPTMSASLYVQMAGRGMRPKSHTDHCLVLDFAGVVEMHGPITNVQPPKKGGSGEGEAPVKVCDVCHEIVHISAHTCPNCGTPFPPAPEKKLVLRHDDIMGLEGVDMPITDWHWRKHVSRASGNEMIALTYYGGLTDPPITEYLPVLNQGYAGNKAMQLLHDIAQRSNATLSGINGSAEPLIYLVQQMNQSTPPAMISYKRDGKFYKVVKRLW
jgi:DNA repair protein RadD